MIFIATTKISFFYEYLRTTKCVEKRSCRVFATHFDRKPTDLMRDLLYEMYTKSLACYVNRNVVEFANKI